jgi:serine/threonine-protein kinase
MAPEGRRDGNAAGHAAEDEAQGPTPSALRARDGEPASRPPSRASVVPASRDPLVGRVVSGRFRVLGVIARGGMGKVYKAEQLPLGRSCALKVLQPKYAEEEDPEFQRRFFLEANVAAKLTHPNTVTIFDFGREDETYFIAMEYIEGRTLHRLLRDDGRLEEARTIRILRQACRSLREAHALGVIHRDMKPANVLLTDRGDERDFVKVLDFGLVKDFTRQGEGEDLTQEGLFMGSPKYMAPEQILGNPVAPGTDVYALGVLAYEMLCGHVPFDRGTSVKTLMAHVHEPPPPMRSYAADLDCSAELERVVMRCLAKAPEDRYTSVDELLDALAEVEQATGLAGMEPTRSGRGAAGAPVSSPDAAPAGDAGPTAPGRILPPLGPSRGPTDLADESAPHTQPVSTGRSGGAPARAWPSQTPAPMTRSAELRLAATPPAPGRRRMLAVAIALAGAAGVAAVVVGVNGSASAPSKTATMPTVSVGAARPGAEIPAPIATPTPTPTTTATATATAVRTATAASLPSATKTPAPARSSTAPAPPPSPTGRKAPAGYKDSPY